MNTAVSWCDPTLSVVVAVAVPLVTPAVPILVVPSMNRTVPAAAEGVSVAVSVSGVFGRTGEVGDVVSMVLVVLAPATVKVTAGEVEAL